MLRKFLKIWGEVIYYGKPIKKFIKCAFDKKKVLAIGDNLRTDIKGANNLKTDCLLIYDGVHRKEFNNEDELQTLLLKYEVNANYFQKELQW